VATRDGRRAEFASFEGFSKEDVPDPQDPATFERSKLTREVDQDLLDLHKRCLQVRRTLPPGDALPAGDEDGRWIRVRRGDRTLVANFGTEPVAVPLEAPASEVVVGTAVADTHVKGTQVTLPAMSGALVR
jgi:maltooligosyltrehalose trehalohydrolase